MKKILFGFLGILMVISVVAASARALFSSTTTVGGVTFATGNANLQIYDYTTNLGEDSWVLVWSPSYNFNNLYPGLETYQALSLKNKSTSPISLSIFGSLRTGVTGDWNELKDVVQVAVWLDASNWTGYHTLADWHSTGYVLPGGNLAQNTQRDYRFYVYIDKTATNAIADKTLSGINFDFVGTQTL